MIRTISSAQTFWMKWVFPAFLIGILSVGTIAIFLDSARGQTDLPPDAKWQVLAVWVLASPLTWWFCGRLKRVRMDGHHLYISNYLQEIEVSLRDVEEITENRWVNIHPVTLRFREDTLFGSSVIFMPKTRLFSFFTSHPIVGELRKAVDDAKQNPK